MKNLINNSAYNTNRQSLFLLLKKSTMKAYVFIFLLDLLLPWGSYAVGGEANCSTGIHVDEESFSSRQPGTWANICPDMVIRCAGQVARWDFFSLTSDGSTVYLSLWRQTGQNTYILVGSNAVNATRAGFQTYLVPPEQRFSAQVGDFVGIFYARPGLSGVIPYAASSVPIENLPTNSASYYHCISFESYRFQIETQMRTRGFMQVLAYPVRRNYAVQVFVGATNLDCAVGLPVPDSWRRIKSNSYGQFCFNMVFNCSGLLHRWDYYSSLDDGSPFYLSAWRQLGINKFALIGLTRIFATRTGRQTLTLAPCEQFRVIAGDFAAIFYDRPQQNGAIPYATPLQGDPPPSRFFDCMASPFYASVIDTQMKAYGYVLIDTEPAEQKTFSFQGFVKGVEQAECPEPPQVDHSRVIGRGRTVAATRTYVCDNGYKLVGAETILCDESGIWRPTPGQCWPISSQPVNQQYQEY